MLILYIDPGVGSLIFQALLSGILTMVVFYKRIIAMVKDRFGKKQNNQDVPNDQD